MAYIEFKNIDLTFQTKTQRIPVFHDFNLSIEQGVFAVIHGASGKGKSTLLNLIAGLVLPDNGEIFVDGENINQFSDRELCVYRNKKIGYIFQSFHLIPEFNLVDNVSVPLRLCGKKKKQAAIRAAEALKSVNMEHRLKEYPVTLSGGEQQRTACARALINQPSIILADEPTGNLDVQTGEMVVEIMRKAQHELGTTIVCVSHDPGIIEQGDIQINIEDYTQIK